jgi:hypothetical protein
MKFTPLANPLLREFWLGLTTPDFGVLKMAAVILLSLLGILSGLAVNFRHQIEAGKVEWRTIRQDFGRSSVLAMRGAARETDPSAKNLVFVGPSSLRCWLPHPDETSALASSAAGGKVRVLAMCGGRQSYAVTAAFVDRFGADFDGWFVIGVGRQAIARKLTDDDVKARQQQSRALGFYSEVLTQTSGLLGFPQERTTGWELWDHRDFHYRYELGYKTLPFRKKQRPYKPYLDPTNVPFEAWGATINPLDDDSLRRHLAVLEQVAGNVRAHGRARVALVETPWVDSYTPAMQTAEWRRDEDAYQQIMREWARQNDVPWITCPASFAASASDFADPKHVGSPALRQKFLETVVRELGSR